MKNFTSTFLENFDALFRRFANFAQFSQTQSIVPFGQPFAIFIQHQFAMKKFRQRQTQGAIKQNLPRGADQQIRAANNFGNFHCRIVHDARELIRGNVVVPPDNEIAKIFSGDKFLFAEIFVVKRNCFAVGNAETPIEFLI